MPGLLLDTHALIWFLGGAPMENDALLAIAEAQAANTLYVSPVTAWEAALAIRRRNPARRPDLQGQDAASWFRRGRQHTGAKLAGIGVRIALEAARIPDIYDHDDPGDCFLIATAHVRKLAIVTRDSVIADIAETRPAYLQVIPC